MTYWERGGEEPRPPAPQKTQTVMFTCSIVCNCEETLRRDVLKPCRWSRDKRASFSSIGMPASIMVFWGGCQHAKTKRGPLKLAKRFQPWGMRNTV